MFHTCTMYIYIYPSKHFHIGPISALCRNIDVGFRYRTDIGPIYIIALLSIFSNYWIFNGLLMLIHLVFYIVNISHKCASQLINIKSTFPYRANIGSMSEYRCRFPISDRYRAYIYNCTVKYFFQLLSIQWIINVNPFSLLYCKHITQVCQSIDRH